MEVLYILLVIGVVVFAIYKTANIFYLKGYSAGVEDIMTNLIKNMSEDQKADFSDIIEKALK